MELLKLMNKFQPKLLRTSPHLLVFLQRFGKKYNLEFPESLRCIYVGGEAFPYKMLKKESKTEIFELYGAIETGLQASDCREHSGLHMNMENSIIQTVNDGEALNYGEKGEIIITDFTNSDTPLIRYNIEDLGIIAEPEKCSCGMQLLKLDGIAGRKIDTLITTNGKAINDIDGIISDINELSFQRGIEQFQIIQNKITDVTVKVVPTNNFSSDTEKIIMMSLKKVLGREVKVKIKVVKRIPHGKKFRYIISKVKNQKYLRTFE
jgi:phenylacetate-CoA ligase